MSGSERRAFLVFKCYSTPLTFKELTDDVPEGRLQAVISTFEVLDRDGEIVAASAFKDGQALPMVWAHDWSIPIGRGVIQVHPDRAVFDGELFLDTIAGEQAFKTMRRMADLQQFSWGFAVTKSEMVEREGQQRRRILESEPFEASPVLVGSNRQTGLLAIKSHFKALKTGLDGHGLSFEDHSKQVQDALDEWLQRNRSRSEIAAKEGRAISAARRTRMASVSGSLRTSADEIDAMLLETEPPPKAADETGAQAQRVAVLRLRSEFDQGRLRRARTLGVSA
jgi:HK97 family phage prohead protease